MLILFRFFFPEPRSLHSLKYAASLTSFLCLQLLSLSVDTCLRPKYEYLVSHLGGTTKTVVDFPAYFSLSLEKRIMPRYKDLCQLDPGGPFPTSLFMWMLRLTDDRFALEVAKRKRSKQKHSGEAVGAQCESEGEESHSQNSSVEGHQGDIVEKELRQVEEIGAGQSASKAEVEENVRSSYQPESENLEFEGAIAAAVAPPRFLDIEGRSGRFRRKVAW
jgi:mTERF domain-containing protein